MRVLGRPMRRSERWSAIACLGAAGLTFAAAVEPLGLPDGTAFAGPRTAMPGAADLGMAGDFLASPPFDPARRRLGGSEALPSVEPPLVAEAMPAAPEDALPALAGILGNGRAGKALFVGSAAWLGVGEVFGNWTVAAVEPRRVVLRHEERELVLSADDGLRR